MTGRSKGIKISVLGSTSSKSLATAVDNGSTLDEGIIRECCLSSPMGAAAKTAGKANDSIGERIAEKDNKVVTTRIL